MRRGLIAGAALGILLGACSSGQSGNDTANAAAENAHGAPQPSEAKLTQLIADNPELAQLSRIVANAGLGEVLNGVGPYTVFAPTDGAWAALGEERTQALAGAEMRPQAAALLRAHIVPGVITRRDLAAAIDHAGDGGAKMRTMAGTLLTFTRDGDTVLVTSEDGARARLSGTEALGANGVVQPVDGLLRKAQ